MAVGHVHSLICGSPSCAARLTADLRAGHTAAGTADIGDRRVTAVVDAPTVEAEEAGAPTEVVAEVVATSAAAEEEADTPEVVAVAVIPVAEATEVIDKVRPRCNVSK